MPPEALAAALALAFLILLRSHRKLHADVRALEVQRDVLTARVDLLCRAARLERKREVDPDATVKMSAHELRRAKRGQGPPSGH